MKSFNLIILAGGRGTRLQSETADKPKPLVEIGGKTLLEHLLGYLSSKISINQVIIGISYMAESIKTWTSKNAHNFNICYSEEAVDDLLDTGTSFCKAIDHIDNNNPVIVTFCDYIYGDDKVSFDIDGIGLYKTTEVHSIPGTFKGLGIVENSRVVDVIKNNDLLNNLDYGFNGLFVFHDIELMKSIISDARQRHSNIDYTFHIVKEYIRRKDVYPIYLHRLFECGDIDTLNKTRKIWN